MNGRDRPKAVIDSVTKHVTSLQDSEYISRFHNILVTTVSMRHRILSILLCCTTTLALAGDAPGFHDIAQSFTNFYDAKKDKPEAEQLASFQKDVASLFPQFYGVARYRGQATQADKDKFILDAIKSFPGIRNDYVRKTREFEINLPRYVASFKTWFPDFQPRFDTWVLHSLGEMDGGTRTFGGKNYLIFGIDGMVRYHGKGNESAFFHHELFHTYHNMALTDCDSDDEPIWNSLWQEGLATYVSKVMNPGANDTELLLSFPNEMAERTRKVLPAAFTDLASVLERRDPKVYSNLFSTSDSASTLPTRRGYYLGYLVAQDAARSYSVQELAKLDCQTAHALVVATVEKLRNAHPMPSR